MTEFTVGAFLKNSSPATSLTNKWWSCQWWRSVVTCGSMSQQKREVNLTFAASSANSSLHQRLHEPPMRMPACEYLHISSMGALGSKNLSSKALIAFAVSVDAAALRGLLLLAVLAAPLLLAELLLLAFALPLACALPLPLTFPLALAFALTLTVTFSRLPLARGGMSKEPRLGTGRPAGHWRVRGLALAGVAVVCGVLWRAAVPNVQDLTAWQQLAGRLEAHKPTLQLQQCQRC